MKLNTLLVLAALIPLAACTGIKTSQERAARAVRIQAAAGAPVNHILLSNLGFYAWEPLNDHQMVAYLTPRRAYLLDLPPCPGLENAPSIAITSKLNRVNVNFDSVTTSLTNVPCQIRQIRPLDMNKLKQAPANEKKDVQVKVRPQSKATGPDA